MKYIEKPNLPSKNVEYVLCDNRVGESIKRELSILGCKILIVPTDNSLDYPICSHPDIHLYHSGKGKFITSSFFFNIFNSEIFKIKELLDCEIFNNQEEDKKIKKGYPNDVPLNVVKVGKYIIGNKESASKKILVSENAKFINVKQGYTKCSVCVVSDEAIITDDCGIYEQAKNYLDTLLVKRGEVILNGYNYGFIGGSCGKVSNDILAFYGCIENFSEYERIEPFCKNHGVSCYSLSKDQLTDFGSLIPLLE